MKKLFVLTALTATLFPSTATLATVPSIAQMSAVYTSACVAPDRVNVKMNICETAYDDDAAQAIVNLVSVIPSCTLPQEFNPISHVCETPLEKQPVLCHTGQFLNAAQTACITPTQVTCQVPQIRNPITHQCELPARNSKTVCAMGKILNTSTSLCIDPSAKNIALPQT